MSDGEVFHKREYRLLKAWEDYTNTSVDMTIDVCFSKMTAK